MTNQRTTTMPDAAARLLDTLVSGQAVTLEITAQDDATGGLLRLIAEVHAVARARRLGITITRVGERGMRLTLAHP